MKAIIDALGHMAVIFIVIYAGLAAASLLGNALDRPALERLFWAGMRRLWVGYHVVRHSTRQWFREYWR